MVSLSYLLNSAFFGVCFCRIMEDIRIIQTTVTTKIRMALNTEPIPPMIVDITLLECTIATTVETHLQGNV